MVLHLAYSVHVCDEHKDDGDWMKCCITIKDDGTRDRDCLRKTWLDCVKEDMKSLGLSQQDEQSRNNGVGKLWGQLANPGSPGKCTLLS